MNPDTIFMLPGSFEFAACAVEIEVGKKLNKLQQKTKEILGVVQGILS